MPTGHHARAALVILASCLACGARPQPADLSPVDEPEAEPVANDPLATEPPAPTETEPAPAVLASADGVQGPIVVEQRGKRRTLLIDGVVQGYAEPESGTVASRDPLDTLMSRTDLDEGRALLIGLGTGRTASALARNGREVDVVELEPKVIEFAREHFEYEGPAQVADGAAFLATTTQTYGLIVFDRSMARGLPSRSSRSRPSLIPRRAWSWGAAWSFGCSRAGTIR